MSFFIEISIDFESIEDLEFIVGDSRYCVTYEYNANDTIDDPIEITYFGCGSESISAAEFPITRGSVVVYES